MKKQKNQNLPKRLFKECSWLIAEVSTPSHGTGIEIGWADSFGIPVIFLSRKDSKPSASLGIISKRHIRYGKVEDVIPELEQLLTK